MTLSPNTPDPTSAHSVAPASAPLVDAAAKVRDAIRSGRHKGHTAGLAPDCQQGNVVILPESHALDFFRFCQRNPRPCPVIGVADTGSPMLDQLGQDIDIRFDLPRYNIYRDGAMAEQADDIAALWRDDLVTFVLGCSFGFEQALLRAGFSLQHIERNLTVPMYVTSVPTTPAGPFSGPMVVSMRGLPEDRLGEVGEITALYPESHGAPVHSGDPAALGIKDLNKPEYGDPVLLRAGEVPVFWACGVTPQQAVERARPPLCITHTPGHMLVTDLPARR